jgi:hypothetical protein
MPARKKMISAVMPGGRAWNPLVICLPEYNDNNHRPLGVAEEEQGVGK